MLSCGQMLATATYKRQHHRVNNRVFDRQARQVYASFSTPLLMSLFNRCQRVTSRQSLATALGRNLGHTLLYVNYYSLVATRATLGCPYGACKLFSFSLRLHLELLNLNSILIIIIQTHIYQSNMIIYRIYLYTLIGNTSEILMYYISTTEE